MFAKGVKFGTVAPCARRREDTQKTTNNFEPKVRGIKILPWTVYILECSDNTLYTGISSNVEQRVAKHENGKGARYTKGRGPFSLVYSEQKDTKGEALKREAEIKSLRREEKLQLISETSKLSMP